MSKKGGASASAATSLISIIDLVNRINDISRLVECIGNNKNLCTKTDNINICKSSCGNTYTLNSENKKIWKIGNNSFGATISQNYFEVGTKNIKIYSDSIKLLISVENNKFEVPLEDKQISNNSSIIINASNKIDEVLRKVVNSTSICARSLGLKC
jgi:hypothetical protein